MYLNYLKIKGHPVLGDIELDFINPKTKEAYSIVCNNFSEFCKEFFEMLDEEEYF